MARPRVSATLFFALLCVALGIALFVATRPPRAGEETRPAAREPAREGPRPKAKAPRPSGGDRGSAKAPDGQAAARIAIVIDDLGNDPDAATRVASLPHLVAGAVLPVLPGSAASARALGDAGKEILLHLPMEPVGYPNVLPGPGLVLRSQSDEEIAVTLLRDLASVPGAVGVNNHMGSAATADPRVMWAILARLAERGLFFLDSRTTDATVAADVARVAGVPVASRSVFLDRVATEDAVAASFEELLSRARSEGSSIAVGHPYPATLAVLERELPLLADKGIELVRIGELVR